MKWSSVKCLKIRPKILEHWYEDSSAHWGFSHWTHSEPVGRMRGGWWEGGASSFISWGTCQNLLRKIPEWGGGDFRHSVSIFQVISLSTFQIYFNVKRILFEMDGIQWESAFPSDPTFDQTDISYDTLPFKRICAEFGIDSSSDFRYQEGENHGLEPVFIYISNLSQQLQTLTQE